MEDLIMKIIDIEARAQEIIKDAKTANENIEADIETETENLRKDIENRALAKAETIRKTEDSEAEKKILEIREKTKLDIENFENKCREMKDGWVNQIVENIVG